MAVLLGFPLMGVKDGMGHANACVDVIFCFVWLLLNLLSGMAKVRAGGLTLCWHCVRLRLPVSGAVAPCGVVSSVRCGALFVVDC